LADIGCGLGLIDFEIASHVKSITAIDIDAALIEEVRKKIDEELWQEHTQASRITPIVADSRRLDETVWDVVMTCFYSVPFPELDALLAKARKRGIIILHGRKPNGKFDPLAEEAEKLTAEDLERYLNLKGYRYKKEVAELQFGQPFKTIEDIHAFLNRFSMHMDIIPETLDAAIDTPASGEGFDPEKHMLSAEERIIKTNRYDYPYYLPKSFNVAIFIIVK
jgi:SAM-dependent methyltransferase